MVVFGRRVRDLPVAVAVQERLHRAVFVHDAEALRRAAAPDDPDGLWVGVLRVF